jgi:hypothetical protein
MHKPVVLSFFFLVALSRANTRFPTDINELELLEKSLVPAKRSTPKLSEKDLDDPDKLTDLVAKLEKMGTNPSPKSKRKDKKKRRLFLNSLMSGINNNAEGIGKLLGHATSFVGVDNNTRKDFVNTGLGGLTLGLGLLHKQNREKKYKRIYGILEHKYHLNNLYLDSIGVQNDNALFVDKMLSRVLRKVVKTRSVVLAKIHASVNPMS